MKQIDDHVMHGRPLPRRAFLITVDDGLREVYEDFAPACRRKGIHAAIFVTSSFIDNRNLGFRHKASLVVDRILSVASETTVVECRRLLRESRLDVEGQSIKESVLSITWSERGVLDSLANALDLDFDEYLRTEMPYLSRSQLCELQTQGFEIGTHSVDHPLYRDLGLTEQLRQTEACLQEINALLGSQPRPFAFPFVADGVRSEFYETALSRGFANLIFCLGNHPMTTDPRVLDRFVVENWPNETIDSILRRHQVNRLIDRLRTYVERAGKR